MSETIDSTESDTTLLMAMLVDPATPNNKLLQAVAIHDAIIGDEAYQDDQSDDKSEEE